MNYSTIIGSSLIAVFSGLWYIGVFDTIKFHEGKIPAGKFVYKNHAGPMKECGPHFSEVLGNVEAASCRRNISYAWNVL